jgi:hypothetical protein
MATAIAVCTVVNVTIIVIGPLLGACAQKYAAGI